MGLFDLLTGRRPPAPGTARAPATDLRLALLGLNRDTSPIVIRLAHPGEEGADLVAEWRLADATWFEIFAKAGLTKVAQVLLRLDDAAGEVRCVQRDWTVEWRAGVPSLSASAEAFRGRKVEVSFGRGFAWREDLSYGTVYDWTLDTKALLKPLQEATAAKGWGWRPVAFGKL